MVDWSMIESALRPTKRGDGDPDHLVDRRHQPKPPSSRRISSHRKALEGEGMESGDVLEKYRKEVIQMKREMAELRSTEPKDTDAAEGKSGWRKWAKSSVTSSPSRVRSRSCWRCWRSCWSC